jgi:hypothetical protein
MVQPVTNEQRAQHVARMIKMFRERLRKVEAEQACLNGLVNELTMELLDYRRQEAIKRARQRESQKGA